MYIKIKSGSKTSHSSYVGPDRSLSIDTDNQILRLHDGETRGGISAAGLPDLPPNDDLIYLLSKDRWVPTGLNEAFSEIRGNWEQLAPIPADIYRYQSALIEDKLHIFGGADGNSTRRDDHWVYDFSLDTWMEVIPSNSPPPGRYSHSVSAINDRMYVFGGNRGTFPLNRSNDLWIYDPVTNNWQQINASVPPPARYNHTSTVIGELLYIFGGSLGGGEINYSNDLWAYNSNEETWVELKPSNPPPGRQEHATSSINGLLFLFGGQGASVRLNDLWIYDPEDGPEGTWTELTPPELPHVRSRATLTAVHGKIYMFGGQDGGRYLNDLWEYDPVANEWSEITPIGNSPEPRSLHISVGMGGKMYVFGGYDGSVRLNDLWVCS